MAYEDIISCTIFLVAILPYIIIYLYDKHKNKIQKWPAVILLIDYIIVSIIINGVITALMTPFLTSVIKNSDLFTGLFLAICIYGGINTLISLAKSEFKNKKNRFVLTMGIVLIILTILSIIGVGRATIGDVVRIILALLHFYYYKKLDLTGIKIATKQPSKQKTSIQETQDKYDTLRKLKSLYDDKIITKEEFEKEKEKILQ